MSRNYKFHNPEGAYFVSFAVVEWIDVFTRNEYKDILLEILRYSQRKRLAEKCNSPGFVLTTRKDSRGQCY